MKQVKKIFYVALVAILAMTVTSCGWHEGHWSPYAEDRMIAQDLDGYWSGEMDASSYRSYAVEFDFDWTGGNHGYGYAREYSEGYRYIDEYRIEYVVNDGYIKIRYDDGYCITIYSYDMYRGGFGEGYLDGVFDDNKSVRSKRIKLTRRGGWYYYSMRNMEVEGDSVK